MLMLAIEQFIEHKFGVYARCKDSRYLYLEGEKCDGLKTGVT